MEYQKAINMAIVAVTMDKILDKSTKQDIIETLSEISFKLEDEESEGEK